jgi:oligopeptide transport system substrate-binding protein
MIGPVVEEVGLRRMPVAVAVASLTAVAGLLAVTTAAAGCGGGDTGSDHVMVNGGEPQNPLIPTNINETNGGRIWARRMASIIRRASDMDGHVIRVVS